MPITPHYSYLLLTVKGKKGAGDGESRAGEHPDEIAKASHGVKVNNIDSRLRGNDIIRVNSWFGVFLNQYTCDCGSHKAGQHTCEH
jgi:hypothetical protein